MADWRLSVVESFDGYVRGQEITDPAIVADILAGEHSDKVVKHAVVTHPGTVDPDFGSKVGDFLAPKEG